MNAGDIPLWAELIAAALLIVGAVFTLIGSFGMLKLSDFFRRLHGPSKATTLGVGCVLLASTLVFLMLGRGSVHELLVTLFLYITAPVSAHLLVKAALKDRPDVRPPLPSPAAPPQPVAARSPESSTQQNEPDAGPAAGMESPRPSRQTT